MSSDSSSNRGLQDGDVVEVRERLKVIGFEDTDVLTMNVETGTVTRWDHGIDRPGIEVEKVDD